MKPYETISGMQVHLQKLVSVTLRIVCILMIKFSNSLPFALVLNFDSKSFSKLLLSNYERMMEWMGQGKIS